MAFRTAKTLWNFSHSEFNRVKGNRYTSMCFVVCRKGNKLQLSVCFPGQENPLQKAVYFYQKKVLLEEQILFLKS